MAQDQARRDFASELQYHRREWLVQRIGWAIMALFIVAAVAGAFGEGLLSEVTRGSASQGTVSHDRFARYGAKTSLKIIRPETSHSQLQMQVEIGRSYLDQFDIASIVPEPTSVRTTSDAVQYSFGVAEGPVEVLFRLEPDRIGSHSGVVKIDSSEPLVVSQFVYP